MKKIIRMRSPSHEYKSSSAIAPGRKNGPDEGEYFVVNSDLQP